jgi:hypothetical protein
VLKRDQRRSTRRDTTKNLEINGFSEEHRDPGSVSLSARPGKFKPVGEWGVEFEHSTRLGHQHPSA